jgi:hypothetical protein
LAKLLFRLSLRTGGHLAVQRILQHFIAGRESVLRRATTYSGGVRWRFDRLLDALLEQLFTADSAESAVKKQSSSPSHPTS